MTDESGHVVRIERTFGAMAEEVFDAWTSPEVMRRWFHCGPDPDEHIITSGAFNRQRGLVRPRRERRGRGSRPRRQAVQPGSAAWRFRIRAAIDGWRDPARPLDFGT